MPSENQLSYPDPSMEIKTDPHQYQWIINEGLLRDEGTLYGLAGAAIQEKMAAIRDYYRIKKAASRTKKEQLNKKIGEINSELSQALSGPDTPNAIDNPSTPIPIILQLLFYTGICFFNYWLERYWLSPVFHSTFICVGLYLFGLFSVFIGRSIMYNAAQSLADEQNPVAQREKWKIYLEEFGVPLVVSLFISILPARTYPIEYSVLGFLFFFMLFLLGGKGLVNTFFRSGKELALHFQYLGKKKESQAKAKELNVLQNDLELTNATLEGLDGEQEYKIKIFTSEYNLAFENRQIAYSASIKKLA
jgi:hypothetical protein